MTSPQAVSRARGNRIFPREWEGLNDVPSPLVGEGRVGGIATSEVARLPGQPLGSDVHDRE